MSERIERINAWFKKRAGAIIRFRWLIIIGVIVLNVLSIPGVMRVEQDSSMEGWLLEGDPLRLARDEFEEIFGNNDYVLVLVEADDVFSSETLAMMRRLGEDLEEEVPFADKVTSIAHLDFTEGTEDGITVDELVPEEIPTDPALLAEIRARATTKPFLVDRLFSGDGTQAAVVLALHKYTDIDGNETRAEAMVAAKVNEILAREEYRNHTLLSGGMAVFSAEKEDWFKREGARLFLITVLVMMIVLGVSLRSMRAVFAPIFTALSAILWVFGIMGYAGVKMIPMIATIPVMLLVVISVGYSVHIVTFFKQHFLATGSRKDSVAHALEHTGWPVLFTVFTTVLGFLSFTVVEISAIRWLGFAASGLVLAAYPLVMALTPALLSFGRDREPDPGFACGGSGRMETGLVRLGEWVRGHGPVIIIVFSVATIVAGFSMPGLVVDTNPLKVMGRRVPCVGKIFYIADQIGSLYAYDVTLEFPEDGMAKDPETLRKLDTLARELEETEIVKRTTSITDIVKDLNQVLNDGDPAYYTVGEGRDLVAQQLLLYEMSGGSDQENWVDYDYRVLRLNVELRRFSSTLVEDQLHYVQERCEELFPDARFGLTGIIVQFARMTNYMVDGQIKSVLIALLCISIVMMVAFGNVRLGLIAMVPNIVPVVLAAGMMARTGITINFTTMMVAPIILGIAVDDTIHYINHFKQAFHRTGSYAQANRETFRSVGTAITMTTVIIVLGFSVFATSVSKSYSHFAVVSIVAVVSALLADYFLTPTLIMKTQALGEERS